MEFWGHTVYDWDDVVPPNALSDGIGSEKTALQVFPLIIADFIRTAS